MFESRFLLSSKWLTYWGLVNTKDLLQVLVNSEEKSIAFGELVTILVLVRKHRSLIFVETLFKISNTCFSCQEISFGLLSSLWKRVQLRVLRTGWMWMYRLSSIQLLAKIKSSLSL